MWYAGQDGVYWTGCDMLDRMEYTGQDAVCWTEWGLLDGMRYAGQDGILDWIRYTEQYAAYLTGCGMLDRKRYAGQDAVCWTEWGILDRKCLLDRVSKEMLLTLYIEKVFKFRITFLFLLPGIYIASTLQPSVGYLLLLSLLL
jgi:hypothetical protein